MTVNPTTIANKNHVHLHIFSHIYVFLQSDFEMRVVRVFIFFFCFTGGMAPGTGEWNICITVVRIAMTYSIHISVAQREAHPFWCFCNNHIFCVIVVFSKILLNKIGCNAMKYLSLKGWLVILSEFFPFDLFMNINNKRCHQAELYLFFTDLL